MITKIEVRNTQGGLLPLTMASDNSGIIIEDITGLDPVKANIVSSSFASMDGSQHQSSQRGNRNIVLTLDLEPDFIVDQVRDIRKYLYGYFMPKTQVTLTFYMDDGLVVNTTGVVEDFSAPLFTQTPKAVISVICFDPDFLGIAPESFTGSTTSDTTEFQLYYEGSSPAGFNFIFNPSRAVSSFAIYNRMPDNTISSFNFQAPLSAGDVLAINSVPGSKAVTLTRSGVNSSMLYGMVAPYNWITLAPGINNMRVVTPGTPLPFSMTYTARYGGL